MIKTSRINAVIFVLMFIVFVIGVKTLALFNHKITGIDYIMWFLFAGLLFLINYNHLSKNIVLKQAYFWLLFILILFCALNYFMVNTPFIIYLQGAFFSFLFAANFIIFYNLKINKHDFYLVVNILILFLTAIAALAWLERIFIERNYEMSFFFRGVHTVVKDAGLAAALLNINIILCLCMFALRKERKYLYAALFSFITISLFLFLKTIAVSIAVLILFGCVFFNKRIRKIIVFIIGGMILLFLIFLGKPFYREVTAKFDLYFGSGSENTPRNALYIAGIKIATDYFPFGCGQGTFGSYPVGKNYSNIYYKYGLDKVHGLGPDAAKYNTANFLFDTYWSHIIGEMGFIAAFFYLWLWLFPALIVFKKLASRSTEVKMISFLITSVTFSIFVESFALSIPEQLQFIMLYAGLGAIAYNLFFRDPDRQEYELTS